MPSAIATRNNLLQRIEQLKTEADNQKARLKGSALESHADKMVEPLYAEAARLEQSVKSIERTPEYVSEVRIQQMNEQVRRERELEQRRFNRLARIQAEQEAYDQRVNSIHWGFVSVPSIIDRRNIIREHLAKLEQRAEREKLLQDPSANVILAQIAAEHGISMDAVCAMLKPKAFETKVKDPTTNKRYVVVTDADGFTYVDHDLSGDSGGQE